MDERYPLDRLGPSRPVPPLSRAAASNPDAVLAWLPPRDADSKPHKRPWTRADACRLVFIRGLHERGTVTDE